MTSLGESPKTPNTPGFQTGRYREIPIGPNVSEGIKSIAAIEEELSRADELPSAQVAALGALLIVHHRYDDAVRVLKDLLEQIIHGVRQGDDSFGDVFYNLGIAQSTLGNMTV